MTAHLRRATALLALAGLAAACASTTSSDQRSDFDAAGGFNAAPDPAPVEREIRNEAAGYQLEGAEFSGDLIFEDRAGLPVVVYRHAVTGAPTVIAELDLAQDWLSDGVRRFEGVSDRGLAIEVVLASQPCQSNGRDYARVAQVRAGRVSYEGCARETGPVIGWTEDLPRYFETVNACQADAASNTGGFVRRAEAEVLHARSEGGASILRYRFGRNGRWDCQVTARGVAWREVSEEAPALSGEGLPIFIPGRVPQAGEGCYLYERVSNAEGALVGALAEDVCSAGMGSDAPPPLG